MKRAKRTIVILSLALASCRVPVATPTLTPQVAGIRMLATTGAAPLLPELAAAYTRPGMLLAVDEVIVNWRAVQVALLSGAAPYALTTYLPPDSTLWAAPIGWDGVAVVVNASNPVAALSVADVRRIFQGRVANWQAVSGISMPVVVVSQEAGADTRLVFDEQVMAGAPITLGARLALSGERVIEQVAAEPGAIGYVSMAFVDQRVRAVPIAAGEGESAVMPTPETVASGTYPLVTSLLVVGREPPPETSLYHAWFAWMQSESGQKIVGRRYGSLSGAREYIGS